MPGGPERDDQTPETRTDGWWARADAPPPDTSGDRPPRVPSAFAYKVVRESSGTLGICPGCLLPQTLHHGLTAPHNLGRRRCAGSRQPPRAEHSPWDETADLLAHPFTPLTFHGPAGQPMATDWCAWLPGRWPTSPADLCGQPAGRHPYVDLVDVLGLSVVARQHLVELLGARYWHPRTSGEWSIARALERRGLLAYDPTRGHRPYVLTPAGRAAGTALRGG